MKKNMMKKDSKIVQKKQGNYKSRYSGELSPKDKIIEKPCSPNYPSRYK